MNLSKRYADYAIAFEATYIDDDWSRISEFFHPDANYEICNMPFHCTMVGRGAIFSGIKRSCDGFDRKCVRKIGSDDSYVKEEAGKVVVFGHISYQRADSPLSKTKLCQIASFEDGRIKRLIDIYNPGESEKLSLWMEKWGEGLDPSYVQ